MFFLSCARLQVIFLDTVGTVYHLVIYEGHLESKERFAIQRYLLIIGKEKNMQVL